MPTFKAVAISDTHNNLHRVKVPPCDFLFHAGDGTGLGREHECMNWLDQMLIAPARHKILIAGNHDWLAEKEPALFEKMCADRGLVYLRDKMVEIEGVKIYGAPWQPWFCDWAFNVERGEDIAEKWELIPTGVDVLITHGPPLGILDTAGDGTRRIGCEDLLNKVLKVKPRVHIFGHIHGSYGEQFLNGTHFINASTCDEGYSPSHAPVEFDLDVDDAR